ncbi:MAG: hypothetical protein ACLURV_11130 [Gallintestinimicrobium sp.]
MSMISDNHVSQKGSDLCDRNPSAMSAYNSWLASDIPVIYTAVSDPVSADCKEDKTPEGNITAPQIPW